MEGNIAESTKGLGTNLVIKKIYLSTGCRKLLHNPADITQLPKVVKSSVGERKGEKLHKNNLAPEVLMWNVASRFTVSDSHVSYLSLGLNLQVSTCGQVSCRNGWREEVGGLCWAGILGFLPRGRLSETRNVIMFPDFPETSAGTKYTLLCMLKGDFQLVFLPRREKSNFPLARKKGLHNPA